MNVNDLVRPKRVRNLQNLDVSNNLKLGHPFDLSGFKDLDKGWVMKFPESLRKYLSLTSIKLISLKQTSVTFHHCQKALWP